MTGLANGIADLLVTSREGRVSRNLQSPDRAPIGARVTSREGRVSRNVSALPMIVQGGMSRPARDV